MYEFLFPEDFLLGTAHSAFQSEGAWDRDGKSMSMMDHFSVAYAGKPVPSSLKGKKVRYVSQDTPEQGCFFYDHYEEYIEDMAKTGQNTFRMSLSWPRIIPTGHGEVNQKAIDHYNKVIDLLLSKGITPLVDLCHWDVPQCLYEEDGAFKSDKFPEWFEAYARVCFAAFGDRVKLWSTFNEACVSINGGYMKASFPPYEASLQGGLKAVVNTAVAHHRAVRAYREMGFDGQIGAVMVIVPIIPGTFDPADIGAARRMAMYRYDLYMGPFAEGKFSEEWLDECPAYREALPADYKERLQEYYTPMDFVGLNYYHCDRTSYNPNNDLGANFVENFYAAPGQKFGTYPQGLMDVVWYAWTRYQLPIYITENGLGYDDQHDEELDCNDDNRITYLREHLRMVIRCIRMGLPVKGYYYWNDADCFEQQSGYSGRFGLTWVDKDTGRRRWKKSRYYFSDICKSRMVN